MISIPKSNTDDVLFVFDVFDVFDAFRLIVISLLGRHAGRNLEENELEELPATGFDSLGKLEEL